MSHKKAHGGCSTALALCLQVSADAIKVNLLYADIQSHGYNGHIIATHSHVWASKMQ